MCVPTNFKEFGGKPLLIKKILGNTRGLECWEKRRLAKDFFPFQAKKKINSPLVSFPFPFFLSFLGDIEKRQTRRENEIWVKGGKSGVVRTWKKKDEGKQVKKPDFSTKKNCTGKKAPVFFSIKGKQKSLIFRLYSVKEN